MPVPLAMDFISKGRNNEAILALEAHLRKNENDSERWRVLGQILQENDQDQKSVPCFVNALRGDPKSLDSLLLLGVSCTNILDEVKAMNYLKHWMVNNPKYGVLKPDVLNYPNSANDHPRRVRQRSNLQSRINQSYEYANDRFV